MTASVLERMNVSHCSPTERPIWVRTARLVVFGVLLAAVGVSSSHVHAQGSMDAARACAVCHSGEQPVGVAPSYGPVTAEEAWFASPVPEPQEAPTPRRRPNLRVRAPPLV